MKFTPPYTVDIWEERDRLSIVVTDSNDNTVAEWWDDEARQMFEDGFFKAGIRKEVLANSVIEYLKSMGRI